MQQLDVLRLLTDGKRHSGEVLAKNLGITRAAVWKHISKLGRWGLVVESVRGRGYRLSRPIDLLSPAAVSGGFREAVAERVCRLDVFSELDSTNRFLLGAPAPEPGYLTVCLAEYQYAGRGRRGRQWNTPFGGGLCLSVGWLFDEMPRDVSALGLAAAVVTRRAIRDMTGRCPSVKWPNDLVWADRKLGGILVELSAECQGTCYVVIGIGVNVSIESGWLEGVSDWPAGAVDLDTMTEGHPPPRNDLARRLIEALYELLATYGIVGFGAHHTEFVAANYLWGRRVAVTDGDSSLSGTVVGVDPDGALVLRTGRDKRRIISGEVSVRPS